MNIFSLTAVTQILQHATLHNRLWHTSCNVFLCLRLKADIKVQDSRCHVVWMCWWVESVSWWVQGRKLWIADVLSVHGPAWQLCLSVLSSDDFCWSAFALSFFVCVFLLCLPCLLAPPSHPLTLSPLSDHTCSSSPPGRCQLITTCYIGSVPCRRSICIRCGFEREPAIFNVGFSTLTFNPAAKSKLRFFNTVLANNVFFFTTYSHLLLLGDTITLYCQGWYTNKL